MSWPAYHKRAESQQVLRTSAEVCIYMLRRALGYERGKRSHSIQQCSVTTPTESRKHLMQWTTVGVRRAWAAQGYAALPTSHSVRGGS